MMIKSSNLNGNFEYELLNENQQADDLREKILALYATNSADILWLELLDDSLVKSGYYKLFYYEQKILKHIILFKHNYKAQKKIDVLNEGYRICNTDIENISQILFSEFNKVQQIIFKGVFITNPVPSSKMIIEKLTDDVIIPLPESMDDYLMKTIGKKTRKHIRVMINRFTSDYPDHKVQYFEKSDISKEQIDNVISLNKERIKTKGIKFALNKAQYQYAASSGLGFLCLCSIDGKIISGMISSVIGEHAYGHIIAHDNSYNKYFVGQIVLTHVIESLIGKKNIKYLHMLGGSYDYKVRHGGVIHDVYTIGIFRNNGINYLWAKSMKELKANYVKFKQILKNNKTINRFYTKLNKIRIQCV